MTKLSIAIDMGAKNNGVFIVKSDKDKIVDKKATTIIIDKGALNFSKKSRRENRHKDRNYKRRKLAKRLLWEFLDKDSFDLKQQELIQGLLNNRGYTFLSIDSEFEELSDNSIEFIDKYFSDLKDCKIKDDFLQVLDKFDSDDEVIEFCDKIVELLNTEYKKKKDEIDKDFKASWVTNYI
jgi:Zn-finger nucleic acid-binding protein